MKPRTRRLEAIATCLWIGGRLGSWAMWQLRRYIRAAETTRGRRGGAALAMSAYLLAIVGFPVWQPAGKTSERFACQSRRCGCRTAEQCWNSCCCFTLEQRIAWARANNAEIPANVLARAARAKNEKQIATKVKVCSHCAAKTKTCCSPAKGESGKRRIVWVDSAQAQKCRGESSNWLTLGMPVFPPPCAVVLDLEFLPIGRIALHDHRELSRTDRPASRPG